MVSGRQIDPHRTSPPPPLQHLQVMDEERGIQCLIEDEKSGNKDISGIPLLSKASALAIELPTVITVKET